MSRVRLKESQIRKRNSDKFKTISISNNQDGETFIELLYKSEMIKHLEPNPGLDQKLLQNHNIFNIACNT